MTIKKIILIQILLSLGFPQFSVLQQTGVLAEKGEPKLGIWINASSNQDNDNVDNFKSISLDYMLASGFEFTVGRDKARSGHLGISYHKKGQKGNFAVQVNKRVFNQQRIGSAYWWAQEDYYKINLFGVKWYNNKGLIVQGNRVGFENKIHNWNQNCFGCSDIVEGSYLTLTIGKYQYVNDWFVTGITYSWHLDHHQKHIGPGGPYATPNQSAHLGFTCGFLF